MDERDMLQNCEWDGAAVKLFKNLQEECEIRLTRTGGLGSIGEVAKKIGRIAQLGERCPYKAEVTGSIPVPPTSENAGSGQAEQKKDKHRECSSDLTTHSNLVLSFRSSAICRLARGRRSAWLGRQIVNLEVAGSNPVGPAIFTVRKSLARAMNAEPGKFEEGSPSAFASGLQDVPSDSVRIGVNHFITRKV